jgi:hypothetical protein
MKRFIAVLTFSLLLFAAEADTLDYTISVGNRRINWSGGPAVTLNYRSLSVNDTLTVALFSNGARINQGQYKLVVAETKFSTVLYDSIRSGDRFTVPLAPILAHREKTGRSEYQIYYYERVGDVKSVRLFCVTLQ